MSRAGGASMPGMNPPALTPDDALAVMAGMPDPAAVRRLEAELVQMPQLMLDTSHLIHAGLYARTVMIPAGTVLTGAMTNHDNVCVVFGDITVTTDEGPQRLTGFHVLPAKAGAKRVGLAHADTWWATLWPTDLTDVQAIEDDMSDESAGLQSRRIALSHADCALIEEATT